MNRTLTLFFITLFSLISLSASAVDVVLTMDRSLSMKGNDPDRESIKGAELFTELLDSNDQLALTTFAQSSECLLPLTSLATPKTRQQINSSLEALQMSGIRTNFESALHVAYQMYQDQSPPAPLNKRVMVLFSDGQLNLGSEAANQAAQQAIFNEIVPKFQAAGIRILGVAFSPESDLNFLSQIADATGGQAFRAEKPSDIYDAFVRLFEQTDQSLRTPIINNEVTVDEKIDALKLLVKRDTNNGLMELTNPSGHHFNAADKEPGVEWKRTPYFDHVTIKKPEIGTWKVKTDNDNKRAYINSDLDLQIKLPTLARFSDEVIIAAKLTYHGLPINPEVIKKMRFSATVFDNTDTVVQQIDLTPSSVDLLAQDQRGILKAPHPGAFEIRVIANGSDFKRQKTRFITLIDPNHAHVVLPPPAMNGYSSELAVTETPPILDPIVEQATKRSALLVLLLTNLVIFSIIGIGVSIWWWRKRQQVKTDDNFDDL
jgi:Mg-chelatase subunit ChlD